MPKVLTTPHSAPTKSAPIGAHPVFRECSHSSHVFWLPDASCAVNAEEKDLEAEDELPATQLTPCPLGPTPTSPPTDAHQAAIAVAQWVFDTYCQLVRHRLRIYNKYRRLIDTGHTTSVVYGRYRRACRLACEQIIQRNLPAVGFARHFQDPVLPLFEIDLQLTRDPVQTEIVTKIALRAVVEVRQRQQPGMNLAVATSLDPFTPVAEGTSSSSSSSFDPG